MTALLNISPRKSKEHLVYFFNTLCLAIAKFHLTCGVTSFGMCSPVLPQIMEAELPPLDAYLHEHEVGTQDGKAKADSPCDEDHKLGDLLDYFLMPNNTGVALDDILCHAVAENIDALQVRLVKCKKVLKQANRTHRKLLTKIAKY